MKVVYNACYGGFSLSREAVLRAREISGNPKWGGACIRGDAHPEYDSLLLQNDYGFICGVARHDPVLVQVVEELGQNSCDSLTKLMIAEIPDGSKYCIDDYDGYESVNTPESIDWITP